MAALAELEARSPLGPDRARTRTSSSRQSPSPRSSFERPLRTPSPTSRLQASFRTLAYQRSSSSLSREWQRDEEDGDAGGPPADEDDPKTPSVRQAGFASSPADVYPVTTQPPVSPRSAAAKARSTRSTTSTAGSDPSPRLVARPARNDYRPGDELAFFREMEQESRLGQDLPLDSASSQSLPRSSSLRAERLRLEIEREARRIRSQASLEELRQDAERASVLEQRVGAELDGLADGRAFSPSPSTSESAPGPETRSAPRVQASHLELRPSSAQASPFRGDETASVRSLGSVGSASFVSAAGSQRSLSARPAGSASTFSLQSGRAGSAQTDFAGAAAFGTGGNARRPRPREAREWTQACWLWTAERSASSKSPIAARLGKTVIKDVSSSFCGQGFRESCSLRMSSTGAERIEATVQQARLGAAPFACGGHAFRRPRRRQHVISVGISSNEGARKDQETGKVVVGWPGCGDDGFRTGFPFRRRSVEARLGGPERRRSVEGVRRCECCRPRFLSVI